MKISPAEAFAQVNLWSHAATVQGMRILSDAAWPLTGQATKQGDAYLFVIALRDMRRAAKFVRDCLDGEARERADAALQVFDRALPHAKDLRDILEHFDEYAIGRGNLRSGIGSGFPVALWYEHSADDYSLHIGFDGKTFDLSVQASLLAISELRSAIADAAMPSDD